MAIKRCNLVWADGFKIRPVWGPCIMNEIFIFVGLKRVRRQHSIAGQSVRLAIIGWSSFKS